MRTTIDIDRLKRERDAIWAAAALCYRNGERWWWETFEDGDINDLNRPYQTEHPWKTLIEERICGQQPMTEFTTQWVLSQVIGMDAERQSRKHSKEVCSILRELGFELSRNALAQSDGSRKRVWEPKFKSL